MSAPRIHFDAASPSVEYELRRVLATTLDDLITMEAADLVGNVIALADSVMELLTTWHHEPPTEGGTDDDTTDQGSPGGETAADDDRAGADSREVGAVVSEVPPAAEEGGVGEPSADAPPRRPDCTSCSGTGRVADGDCGDCAGSGLGLLEPGRCRFVYPPVAIQCVRSATRGYTVCSDHGR